jgi:hypothetical protein
MPTEQRERYLQLPAGHERVAALAREVTASAKNELDMAQKLVRYLQSSRYKYSLSLPDVGARPPLEAFLFDFKSGHCEYFASAMAIMLRSLGIPARNVTGFVGGRYNPYGGYYALRQGDAHSWVEAYVEGRGWVTYDPTPTLRAELGPKSGMWADLQAFMDALKTRWLTSVVGYDLRTQISLLRKLAQMFADSDAKGGGAARDNGDQLGGLKRFGKVVVLVLVGVGAAVAALIWFRRRRRSKQNVRVLRPEVAEVVRLYQQLERVLEAAGYGRLPSTTPQEHVKDLEAASFELVGDVRLVTERYMQVRYGSESLSEAERMQLKAAIERLKRAPRRPTQHTA